MRLRLLASALAGLGLAPLLPPHGVEGQGPGPSGQGTVAEAATVVIPAGRYMPFYVSGSDSAGVAVASFRVDVRPVTVGEFRAFLVAHPEWQRGRAPRALVGAAYLRSWSAALDPGATPADRPATEVSWFAARAYCRAAGGRLPTTDEWEYLAQASEVRANAFRDAAFNARSLALIQGRAPAHALPAAGTTDRNVYGVRDLYGLVWEWTSDFNNQMLTGAARDDRGLDRGRFCAAGSLGTSDLANYAAFLRWAYRSSLTGTTTAPLLGFRCAG